jgi:antitoxin FitA
LTATRHITSSRPIVGPAVVALVAQNGSMPNIQIKDVPDETHAVLRQRASAAHQSLQEYLRSKLIAEASQPTIDELLDRAGRRRVGSLRLTDAVGALRFDRARH